MTNVKRYNINYNRHIAWRIPAALRSNELLALITIFCAPFIYCYNNLIGFRARKLYEISITPQVCYLEKMLNDRYDVSLRRIYIADGTAFASNFDYLRVEGHNDYLFTRAEHPNAFDFLRGELTGFSYNFIVFVPLSLSFDMNEMVGLVRNYKLASKLFSIQTF